MQICSKKLKVCKIIGDLFPLLFFLFSFFHLFYIFPAFPFLPFFYYFAFFPFPFFFPFYAPLSSLYLDVYTFELQVEVWRIAVSSTNKALNGAPAEIKFVAFWL